MLTQRRPERMGQEMSGPSEKASVTGSVMPRSPRGLSAENQFLPRGPHTWLVLLCQSRILRFLFLLCLSLLYSLPLAVMCLMELS